MTIIHRTGRRFVSRLLQLMPDLVLARRGESEILERAIRGVKVRSKKVDGRSDRDYLSVFDLVPWE